MRVKIDKYLIKKITDCFRRNNFERRVNFEDEGQNAGLILGGLLGMGVGLQDAVKEMQKKNTHRCMLRFLRSHVVLVELQVVFFLGGKAGRHPIATIAIAATTAVGLYTAKSWSDAIKNETAKKAEGGPRFPGE